MGADRYMEETRGDRCWAELAAAKARIVDMEKELTALRTAQRADAERVRSVVIRAIEACMDRPGVVVRNRIADRVAAELATPMPTRVPGYEPCRDCRYWLGVVTESCAAHRALVLSDHDRANLVRLRDNEERVRAAIGHLSSDVAPQCERTIALLDRLLRGGMGTDTITVSIPVDLAESVSGAIMRSATRYREDTGHSPEGIAALHADADRLDAIAESIDAEIAKRGGV